jgi:alkylation response protein AidB-like acyl-CoA dehydrogenase
VNFDLSEDEEMLKALTERFVADRYAQGDRRTFLAEPKGFSSNNWKLLGELGLIAAPLPEAVGGLDLDATGIATVFEALGRGLVVEPLAEAVVFAGRLFARNAPEDLLGAWSEALLSGEKRLALAHVEADARDGRANLATRARLDGTTAFLSGAKAYCIAGGGADAYLVTAHDADARGGSAGAIYLVPRDAPGLTIRDWRLADGSIACSLTLEDVAIPAGHRLHGGLDALAEADQIAALARSAEALGIMERLFADTLDYIRTRTQFGSAIGSFQAIQHRMVAQYASLEQCRALIELALVSSGTKRFESAVYGARALIAEASLALGHEMIQFHGGMGITDELAVGAGHKRLLVLSRWPEGPQAALDRCAELTG